MSGFSRNKKTRYRHRRRGEGEKEATVGASGGGRSRWTKRKRVFGPQARVYTDSFETVSSGTSFFEERKRWSVFRTDTEFIPREDFFLIIWFGFYLPNSLISCWEYIYIYRERERAQGITWLAIDICMLSWTWLFTRRSTTYRTNVHGSAAEQEESY